MRPEVRRVCGISGEFSSERSGESSSNVSGASSDDQAAPAASASSAACDTLRPVAVRTLRAAIAAIERGETLQRIGERDLAAARQAQRREAGSDEISFEAPTAASGSGDGAHAPLLGAADGSGDLGAEEDRSPATPPIGEERREERRTASCDGAVLPTGWPLIDAALGGGLPLDGVHEWVPIDGAIDVPAKAAISSNAVNSSGDADAVRGADEVQDAAVVHAAASGREVQGTPPARGRAPMRPTGWFPPLGVAIALLWQVIESSHWRPGARILWVGSRVRPLPQALLRWTDLPPHGAEPLPDLRLLQASWVVDRPPPQPPQRARWGRGGGANARTRSNAGDGVPWLLEQAIRNPGVAAVVADGSGLAMAASRRLHLAAQRAALDGAATLVLLLRPPWEAKAISAALTRWRVAAVAAPQGKAFSDVDEAEAAIGSKGAHVAMQRRPCGAAEAVAATPPAWRVVLDRCKSHRRGAGSPAADGAGTAAWMHGACAPAAVVDAATATPPSLKWGRHQCEVQRR